MVVSLVALAGAVAGYVFVVGAGGHLGFTRAAGSSSASVVSSQKLPSVLMLVSEPVGKIVDPYVTSTHEDETKLEEVNTRTGHGRVVADFGTDNLGGYGRLFPDGKHALVGLYSPNMGSLGKMQAVDLVDLTTGKKTRVKGLPLAQLRDGYFMPFTVVGEDAVGIAGPLSTYRCAQSGSCTGLPRAGHAWVLQPSGVLKEIWSWNDTVFEAAPNFAQGAGKFTSLDVQPYYYVAGRDAMYLTVTPGYSMPVQYGRHPSRSVSAEFELSHGRLEQVTSVTSSAQSIALLANGDWAYVTSGYASGYPSQGADMFDLHVGTGIPSPLVLSVKASDMWVLPGPGPSSVTLLTESPGMQPGEGPWHMSVWTEKTRTTAPEPVLLASFPRAMCSTPQWSPSGSLFVAGLSAPPTLPVSSFRSELVSVDRTGHEKEIAAYQPYATLAILGFVQG